MREPCRLFLEGREFGESDPVIVRVAENLSSVVMQARMALYLVTEGVIFLLLPERAASEAELKNGAVLRDWSTAVSSPCPASSVNNFAIRPSSFVAAAHNSRHNFLARQPPLSPRLTGGAFLHI
jgi:hypothetical protein